MAKRESTMPIDPAPLETVYEVFVEAARILVLGKAYCDGLPWNTLDIKERAEWLPRGCRYRRVMERRDIIMTANDDRQ